MSQELTQQELMRTLSDAGYKHMLMGLSSSPQQTVISGNVCFDTLASGLNVHCTDTIERSTGQMVSEVSPMLSINFLLDGDIRYGLNGKDHQFSATPEPVTFISLITQPCIFKREFKTGNKVNKLNISVEPSWLLARCKQQHDQVAIKQLFKLNTQVFHWPSSEQCQKMVRALLELHARNDLVSVLEAEQIALQLMLKCYRKLVVQTQTNQSASVEHINKPPIRSKYEDQIDGLIHQSLNLEQLSDQLGASISTLQRYFKRVHQMTLKQYIRNQKLELARRLLIFEQKTIGEAAYAAGYNHPSNFIKAFKSYFQLTPAELQKQYTSGKAI